MFSLFSVDARAKGKDEETVKEDESRDDSCSLSNGGDYTQQLMMRRWKHEKWNDHGLRKKLKLKTELSEKRPKAKHYDRQKDTHSQTVIMIIIAQTLKLLFLMHVKFVSLQEKSDEDGNGDGNMKTAPLTLPVRAA